MGLVVTNNHKHNQHKNNNKGNNKKDYQKAKHLTTNAHDKTFKSTFKQKPIAKDVLLNNLPEKILNLLDFDSMHLEDGSFITSKTLKESFSDIVYSIRLENTDLYVAFLFEHKSYSDKFTSLQVARYIIDLWEQVLRNKNYLPIVIPIVFYHGKQRWNFATDLRDNIKDYHNLPEYFKERIPTLKHNLISMEKHNEKRMYDYHPVTRIILRSFKYINYDKQTLLKFFILSIDELSEDIHNDDIQRMIDTMLLYYSAVNKNISEDDITKKVHELDGKGAKIVTILQQREEKGREEGRLKGREETRIEMALNMLKDGLNIERVAKYSGLSIKQVKELQKHL